jgi:hypothetical protein
VFGLIEFFSGRLFHTGIAGKFNSESYPAFLVRVLAQTTQPIVVIQDGAKDHPSKATKKFFYGTRGAANGLSVTVVFASYNPMEYLWRNTKKDTMHNKYFAQFQQVVGSVETTLNKFAQDAAAAMRVFDQYCDELGLSHQPAN